MWRKQFPFVFVLLVRLRFFFSPLTTDEGGYLAVSRAWFRGADLYKTAWVDRPQGLLVVYGLLDRVGLGNTFGVRLLGTAACFLAMWMCAHVARTLYGDSAFVPVLWSVGLALSIPQVEGFIANAELLSCAVGAASLAYLLRGSWGHTSPILRDLFVGGLLAGAAVTLKQSGFDAAVAGCVAVLLVALTTRWAFRSFAAAVGAVVGGVAVPVGLVIAHATLTGFHDWWYAVAGVRIEHKSALASADWSKLRETGRIVAPLVAGALLVVVLVLVRGLRATWRQVVVLKAWAAVALVAFLMGGLFHRHYWMILMFPFGTAVGIALSRVRSRTWMAVAVATASVWPGWRAAQAISMDDVTVARVLDADSRLVKNEKVAAWLRTHNPGGEKVWAMCASSALYAQINQDPPFRYSWFEYFRATPEALPMLYAWLESDDAPQWIAAVQSAGRCDPSGKLGDLLAQKYHLVDGVGEVQMLRLAD